MSEIDVIVVGAGHAGENVAGRCAAGGLSTVIVERELVGAECSYWGCIPSKTLARPGDVIAAARRVPGAAAAVTGEIDVAAALARRDYMTSNWDDAGALGWLESEGIELVRGAGRLAGERTVEVETKAGDSRRLAARVAVVLATGTGAFIPPIPAWPSPTRGITARSPRPRRSSSPWAGVRARPTSASTPWAWSRAATSRSATSCVPPASPAAGSTRGRLQRPGPAHPHGQVPGPRGRRRDFGKEGQSRRRRGGAAPVPRVTFTDPQVCAAGLTEVQARDAGVEVRAVTYPTGNVSGAYTQGDGIAGTSHLVIDESRSVIVGATFTGPGVAELLHSATIAIVGEVTMDQLWHAVPSFPTVSEVWLRLMEAYGL